MYSSAFNNTNIAMGQPDPQTGIFSFSHALFSLNSQYGLNPCADVSLMFSPMNSASDNARLGKGWGLSLSSYQSQSRQLTLRNKTYIVLDDFDDNNWQLSHKLNDIRVARQDGLIVIYYKDGSIEELEIDTRYGDAYQKRLVDKSGRFLRFEYNLTTPATLDRVYDEQDNCLLAVDYTDPQVTFTYLPGGEQEETISLELSAQMLMSVTQPDGAKIDFQYFEDFDTGLQFVSQVNYPTGAAEWVTYGHRMPLPAGALYADIPAMSSYKKSLSSLQPDIEVLFEEIALDANNYWGNNTSVDWALPQDNLAELAEAYEYTVTTTSGEHRSTYRYNKFHSLTERTDTHIPTGNRYVVNYEYYGDASIPLSDPALDARYELAAQKTVVFYVGDKASTIFEEKYQFDLWGNLEEKVDISGITRQSVYYSASGEKDENNTLLCPPHPFGMVAYKKLDTVVSLDNETRTSLYTYKALPGGYGAFSPVAPDTLSYHGYMESRKYFDEGPYAGEVKSTTQTYAGQDTVTSMEYLPGQGNSYVTKTTLTGCGGSVVTQEEETEYWTGEVLAQTSLEGVRTEYSYDVLGRCTAVKQAAGSVYESIITAEYTYPETSAECLESQGSNCVTIFSESGIVKEYFNHEQKELAVYRSDNNGAMHKISEITYDAQGRKISESSYDYEVGIVPDNTPQIHRQRDYQYGAWGEITREIDNSGPTLVRHLDPLSLSVTEYLQGEDGTRTASVRRTWNASGQVESEARFVVKQELRSTSENEPYSEWTKTYDGFNRLKTFISPLKNQTFINLYDDVDRVLSYSVSDGVEIRAEYPQTFPIIKSPSSLTAKRGETLNSLGSRTFDDLGRLSASEVGGNRRQYLFEQFASTPSGCITGNGNRLDFGYLPELDMSTGVTAYVGDNEEPEETVTFSYAQQPDTPKGLLQSAVCDNGSYQYQYDATGMVVRTVQTSGEQVYSVDVLRNTLQGIPLEESTPDGTQSQTFDKYGRLSHSTSGAFTTHTEYDALNRVCAVFVEENGVMIQGTRLTYDVFSRETTRKTEFLQRGSWLEHKYVYDEENRLVKRTTRTGDEQIAETYDYDKRGRLHRYAVESGYAEGLLPRDEDGRGIIGLLFSYDGLDNLNSLVTMFPNGEQDTGTYSYLGQQLTTINHTLTEGENGYPEAVRFDYDAEGNMTSINKPGNEKTLTYSVRGQVSSVNGVVYRYDTFGRQLRVGERNFRYLGQRVHSIEENGTATRFVRHGGVITASVGAETQMYATDRQGSVVATSRNTKTDLHTYTPGGEDYGNDSLFGYNGELKDTVSGGYMLGQGVRLYQPSLGCFTSQDPLSALSGGDMNPYRYCHGDSVNYADPSGMMGVGAALGNILGNILGIVTGLILMAPTGGASGVEVMMGVAEISAVTASAGMAASENAEGAKVAGVVAGILGLTSVVAMGGASSKLRRRDRRNRTVEAVELRERESSSEMRLIGFHGSSEQGANALIRSEANTKIYITNSSGNASYYADAAAKNYGGNPKILAAYVRGSDVEEINTIHFKSMNSSYMAEVILSQSTANQQVRWQLAEQGTQMDDFHEFWSERLKHPLELLSANDLERLQNLSPKSVKNKRFGFLKCFRRK
ncbi:RHS repeat domain-containing protein [Aliivibrio sp. SR45-2]|uniref:RHS repeat domain-containing protein n=1 Tax=Aliivibrio sp. SR45-2 TaxID=2760931 RepID=UPI0015FA4DEF|nr:RHS repeat-associated core domain-containing protein [Aliivibrio sp. SR45-2]MBB1313399.1 hypothetical protein [Aliivibrio sp. SR45-2]